MPLRLAPDYPSQTLPPEVKFQGPSLFTVSNPGATTSEVHLISGDYPPTNVAVNSALQFRLTILARPWQPTTQVDLTLPGDIILRFSQGGVAYFVGQTQFAQSALTQPTLPTTVPNIVDEVRIQLKLTNNGVVVHENDRSIGTTPLPNIPQPIPICFHFSIMPVSAKMGIRVEDWNVVNIA